MKTALLLAAVVLTAAVSLQAADRAPVTSPRAKANANRTIAGEGAETLDRSFPVGTPRANQCDASRKSIKGTTANALDRTNTGMAAKQRNKKITRTEESEIVPVK